MTRYMLSVNSGPGEVREPMSAEELGEILLGLDWPVAEMRG